ncbi:hypothetical protein H6P81_000654 [Aristolochia fimbriata]|uniref:Uncharacterized protein n=1 Tax=Aristolochia fimbriata TaxID=158543 RepID=A0AAV7F7V3_ARIFI|nr:hypothetical protein H6P81_000654 [Aristolochia fimbriata]
MEESTKPSSPESVDVERFDTSLRELRDLRSQLHFAADYCEQTFSLSNDRKTMIEDTKEYICRAMVTVVDHLGNVSANIECLLGGTCPVSDTQFRLHCLDQKLLTCRQYTEMVDIGNMRSSNALLPRYHRRYSRSCNLPPLEKSTEAVREVVLDSAAASEPQKGLNQHKDHIPVIRGLYTRSISVRGTDLSPAFPASDGPSILSKPRTPSFGSWAPKGSRKHGAADEEKRERLIIEGTHQLVSKERTRKMAPRSNFKVFLRRTLREPLGAN